MVLATLESLLEKEQISKKIGDYHPLGNNGLLVVYPKSEDQISALLHYAYEQGLSVIPEGGGTKRGFGGIEPNADLVLSLSEYGGIVEYSEGDLTMTLKSGTTIKEIQEYLRKNKQMLPLDPSWPELATIGGVIASNDSGPKRCRYGSARDLVIGLRLVYPNGEVIRTGGKVVKNVAGYDMNKLFIGSMGTLAIMSEVTLKLRPMPKYEALVLLTFAEADLANLKNFIITLQDSFNEPHSLEILNPSLNQQSNGRDGYGLAIAFEDVKEAVEYQVKWTEQHKPEGAIMHVLYKEDAERWWTSFSHISHHSAEEDSARVLGLKIASNNMDVIDILSFCEQAAHKRKLQILSHGGAGHGISRVFLRGNESEYKDFIEEIRTFSNSRRAHVVIQHATLTLRQQMDVWGEKPLYFSLLEGIKRAVDPQWILCPKRFVGGI